MNKVMAMTALAASLLVSSAALAAPSNLADALQPASGLTLVKGGGGGGSFGGGHMGGGSFGGGGHIAGGGGHFGGNAGPHFSGDDHIGGTGGGPRNGGLEPRYGANDHVGNGNGHYDHDHFNHDHGRHVRYFPGDAFFYGGDYADYGSYGGDCSWLARQARATGSAYWWHRYQACTF
jgi:hypothetical protein